MTQIPPPYANIAGISRADMKDNRQEPLATYDGNARPGELVVDLTTFNLYIGNAEGNLNLVTSGGGGGTPSAPTNAIQYNNAGTFGGDSRFLINAGANTVTLNTAATISNAIITVAGISNANIANANIVNANVTGFVTGDLIPSANITYSLGSPTNHWKDLWISNNTIYINSIPVSIDSANNLTVNGANVVTAQSNGTINTTEVVVTGNVDGGNITTSGYVSATGNVTAAANIHGTYFIGNGALLTGLPTGYSNANVASYLPSYSGNLVSLTGPITTPATVTTGNINVTAGNTINFAEGGVMLSEATGGLTGTVEINGATDRGISLTAGGPTPGSSYSQLQWVQDIGNYNPYSAANSITNWVYVQNDGIYLQCIDNLTTGNTYDHLCKFDTRGVLTTTGNIEAVYFIGNGSQLTGLPTGYSNADVSTYLASGNNTSDIETTGYFIGDGGLLSNIQVSAGTAIVNGNSNVTVGASGDVGFGIHGVSDILVVGNTGITVANTATVTTLTTGGLGLTGNIISSVGDEIIIDPLGDSSPGTGNVRVLGNLSVAGNLTYTDVSSAATANLTWIAANTAATPSAATGGGLVVGPAGNAYATWLYDSVANSWVSNISATATHFIGEGGNLSNITGANVSGPVASANNAQWVTTNAQPNITSVGVLSAVSVTGNANVGNLNTTGNVSGTYILGNGAFLTGISGGGGTSNAIVNGASNVTIDTAGGNIDFAVAGVSAGSITTGAVSIGVGSGTTNQLANAIAIGVNSAQLNQQAEAIAIGSNAAISSQGANAIAIGHDSGGLNQSANSVAIGAGAHSSNSAVVLNATGATLLGDNRGFYVAPVRNDTGNTANVVYFNTATNELTYAPLGSSYGDSNVSSYLAGGTDTANITTTGNINGANVLTSGRVSATANITSAANVVATANVYAGNVFVGSAGTNNALRTTAYNSYITLANNIAINPDGVNGGLTIGGGGYILAPNGARVITLSGTGSSTATFNGNILATTGTNCSIVGTVVSATGNVRSANIISVDGANVSNVSYITTSSGAMTLTSPYGNVNLVGGTGYGINLKGNGGTQVASITSGGQILMGTANTNPLIGYGAPFMVSVVPAARDGFDLVGNGNNNAFNLAHLAPNTDGTGVYATFAAFVGAGSVASHAYGSIVPNGAGLTYNTTSDARLKTNVTAISDALAKVNTLRAVDFDWLDGSGSSQGFIAQEAEPVIPHAVNSDGEHLMMDYSKAVPMLWAAVQELSAEVAALRAQLGK